jgi:hypothetical protein
LSSMHAWNKLHVQKIINQWTGRRLHSNRSHLLASIQHQKYAE